MCSTCGAKLGAMTYFRRRDGKSFFLCSPCKALITKPWADAMKGTK